MLFKGQIFFPLKRRMVLEKVKMPNKLVIIFQGERTDYLASNVVITRATRTKIRFSLFRQERINSNFVQTVSSFSQLKEM